MITWRILARAEIPARPLGWNFVAITWPVSAWVSEQFFHCHHLVSLYIPSLRLPKLTFQPGLKFGCYYMRFFSLPARFLNFSTGRNLPNRSTESPFSFQEVSFSPAWNSPFNDEVSSAIFTRLRVNFWIFEGSQDSEAGGTECSDRNPPSPVRETCHLFLLALYCRKVSFRLQCNISLLFDTLTSEDVILKIFLCLWVE